MNPKQLAGEKAVEYVKDGMAVGLGTGSTAYWAIRALGEKVKQGLNIKAIATSRESEQLARELNIPIVSFAKVSRLDITIDGADEVDKNFNLIKGGGGALLREKIVASGTNHYIIIVDENKCVNTLGKFPLPVEIVQYGWEWTFSALKKFGCTPVFRKKTT
jgi:ribose 5-phosphate isomerase A